MPFKVTFSIYEPGKRGAVLKTTDVAFAKLEYAGLKSKPGKEMTSMTYEIELVEPTKAEEYVFLVHSVRKAIRHYYNQRGHVPKEVEQDNLKKSLALERQLDLWNARTRVYLQQHPKATIDDEKAFAFFQIVDTWRGKWHQYFAWKKSGGDKRVLQMMRKECQDYETQIDNYIKQTIGI